MTINVQGFVYATQADKSVAITAYDGGNQVNIELSQFQALELARDLANIVHAFQGRVPQSAESAPF